MVAGVLLCCEDGFGGKGAEKEAALVVLLNSNSGPGLIGESHRALLARELARFPGYEICLVMQVLCRDEPSVRCMQIAVMYSIGTAGMA